MFFLIFIWPAILFLIISLILGIIISSKKRRIIYAGLIAFIGSIPVGSLTNYYLRGLCSIDYGPICPFSLQNFLHSILLLTFYSFITIYLGIFLMGLLDRIFKK